MSMNIKMAVIDLDGTLLNERGQIEAVTRDILLSFQEQGGTLVVASGRRKAEIEPLAVQLQMKQYRRGYVVYCDGNYTWSLADDRIAVADKLSGQDICLLANYFDNQEYGFNFYAADRDCKWTASWGWRSVLQAVKHVWQARPVRVYRCIEDVLPAGACFEKVTLRKDGWTVEQMLERLLPLEIYPDRYCFFLLENHRLEISHRNTSKLSAVLNICRQLGCWEDEVLVIGNDGNDLPLLEYFRHSYAVANASQRIKEAAVYTTPGSFSRGVYQVMAKVMGGE